jgi:glutaconate CoA-transferase subunit B
MSEPGYTRNEMMIAAAARELAGQRVCFVGIGLPNIAVNLALHTVAPELELIYEAGVYGAVPARLPLSIGDPTIVTGSRAVMSQADLFGLYLQRGLVDVGFLGAAQIDRYGNINTTVIGDYRAPTVRLPGSGGANEIALHSRQVFVVMRQSRRAFVEQVDFVTSPGNVPGGRRGPSVVVTDLGLYRFDEDGQMRLDSLHPGASLEDVRGTIEWDVRVAEPLGVTPPPSAEELRLMREVLDPERRYLG